MASRDLRATSGAPSRPTSESTSAAFTPGPWSWDTGLIPPDGPQRYADIYVNGGDTIIAHFNDLIPEGRANALLMVAAPDLLESLTAATEALVYVVNAGPGALDATELEGLRCYIENARQAIAKALGEQP